MDERTNPREQFELCVRECADSMYRVAFRLTGNRTLANELVQETYFQAWKNIESLKDRARMKGWLFSILRNQQSKLLRKERNHRADPFVDLPMENDRSETEDLVQFAIGQLEESSRLPILLVVMEGVSVNEAAEILDVPRGTVLSRIHRGKDKLKRIIESQANKNDI